MSALIELEKVSKLFGTSQAVTDVSLKAHKAEICTLIGSSGCGKTTSLKMINRLVEPSNGKILVRGHDVQTLDPVELRRSMGYVIQQIGLFPHMTVEKNITVLLRLLGWDKERQKTRAQELCELVGLAPYEYLRRYPRQLSGGEQQRVGVARALAADPDIILMDEPFGAVDPITRKQLQREMKRIQSEVQKTIVFVTHDLSEAFFLSDHIVVMQNGKVQQDATPRELLLAPANEFVAKFIAESRHFRGLQFQCVDEIMQVEVEMQHAPGEGTPWVFADESVLDAIRRLSGQTLKSQNRKPRAGILVLNRSRQEVGAISYERLVQVLGEAMPDKSEMV